MKRHVLSLLLLALGILQTTADDLEIEESKFDVQGRFSVQIPVPAGTRHASLEALKPGTSPQWRTLVSGALDGRKARVIFKLPGNYAASAMVRAKAGPETTVPAAELNDPELVTVVYESPIGEQTKINFLKDAAAKMAGWGSLPRAEAQSKLIAWAMTNALVADASVTTLGDNISIRFTDDDIVVLMAKPRRYDLTAFDRMPSEARVEIPSASGREQSFGTMAATGLSIPRSKQAITAFSLESTFPSSTTAIGAWLKTGGYEVDSFNSTSVLDIMSWSTAVTPMGVLFWQIHGCPYKKKDGTESVGLVTREFATEALSKGAYAAMRGTGQLGLAIADGETVPYYTITGKFVKAFMRFAPNSLVVVDACFGANQDLANAFLEAGAGSYVSWDWLSGPESGTPCRQLFDRLLGMNQEAPISAVKERPFTVDVVSHWMHMKGYEEDPSTKFPDQTRPNSVLIWNHRQQNPAHMLRPSVMRVLEEAAAPNEPFTKLLLEGDFGDDPGIGKRTVTWGGRAMDVVRWEEEEGIAIRIPNPAPVGNVQVLIQREFESKSNEVPMTEWTVPFTFEHREQGSLKATILANVKFRADIHGERYEPEGPVVYLVKPFSNIADCKGTLTATGTYSPSAGKSYTWSGGSSLVSIDSGHQGDPPPNLIVNGGAITGTGTTLYFWLTASGSFTETYKWTDINGGVHTEIDEMQTDVDGSKFFVPLPTIHPTTYVFSGGNKTVPNGSESETLTWPAVTPAAKPASDTPR